MVHVGCGQTGPATALIWLVAAILTAGAAGQAILLPSTNATQGYDWPAWSQRRCVGNSLQSRACYFRNVAFDKKLKTFVYIAKDGADPAIGNPTGYLRLGIGAYRKQDVVAITTARAFPPTDMACVHPDAVYLHGAYHGSCFGHVLRDNAHNIVFNLNRLGVADRNFTLAVNDTYISPVMKKYTQWVASGVSSWHSVLASCARRFVVFPEFVIGNAMLRDLRAHSLDPSMCKPLYFIQQRDHAYRLAGLQPRPAVSGSDPESPLVLILDKEKKDPRRILNVEELVPALRSRFPDATVKSHVMSKLDPMKQLELLSRTSVLIAGVGSASFRLIFLPTGAHTILVGAPEQGAYSLPFREADACWCHLAYVAIDRYHVTEKGEWESRHTRPKWQKTPGMFKLFYWWDSDTRLNATKLGNLVQAAIADS